MFSCDVRLFGAREAGCFREVATSYSDHYRKVPLYCSGPCLLGGSHVGHQDTSALDRCLH